MSHCSACAPHRLCASSSVRLIACAPHRLCASAWLFSLMATLFLCCLNARAGTYVWQTTDANGGVTAESPAFSGGTVTSQSFNDKSYIYTPGQGYGTPNTLSNLSY